MSNGPLPSQLSLLSDLPSREMHSKVRFLSCVTSYSTSSGILTLEHHQPIDTRRVFALVNVGLVLESLKAEQTRPGQWVNVIGYITNIIPFADKMSQAHQVTNVHVQALLIWSAGPLDLERYENSVQSLEGGKNSALARSASLSDALLQP